MKLSNIFRTVFVNYLPKEATINSSTNLVIKNGKIIIYCFAYKDGVLLGYVVDGLIGETKEIDEEEINRDYCIYWLKNSKSLRKLKQKHDLIF